jgi:hypothetical protein
MCVFRSFNNTTDFTIIQVEGKYRGGAGNALSGKFDILPENGTFILCYK